MNTASLSSHGVAASAPAIITPLEPYRQQRFIPAQPPHRARGRRSVAG